MSWHDRATSTPMGEWSAYDAHCNGTCQKPCEFCAEEGMTCDRCGQSVDQDGEPNAYNDWTICDDCVSAEGMQHHAPYVLMDKWHAKGGHCLCEDCAPPRKGQP